MLASSVACWLALLERDCQCWCLPLVANLPQGPHRTTACHAQRNTKGHCGPCTLPILGGRLAGWGGAAVQNVCSLCARQQGMRGVLTGLDQCWQHVCGVFKDDGTCLGVGAAARGHMCVCVVDRVADTRLVYCPCLAGSAFEQPLTVYPACGR